MRHQRHAGRCRGGLILLMMMATASSASAQADWPMFHADALLSGVSLDGAAPTSLVTPTWYPSSSFLPSTLSSPTVQGGNVYFGTDAGKLYSLDASDLSVNWIYTPFAISPDMAIRSTPAVVGGHVYYVSRDHKLRCLNAATGALEFQYSLTGTWDLSGPPISSAWIDASPTVKDGYVYVAARNGKLYKFAVGQSTPTNSLVLADKYIVSTPAILEDGGNVFVYLIGNDGATSTVYCINAADLSIEWQEEVAVANPAVTPIGYGSIAIAKEGVPRLFFGTEPEAVWQGGEQPVNYYFIFGYYARKQPHPQPQQAWVRDLKDVFNDSDGCNAPGTPAVYGGFVYFVTGRGVARLTCSSGSNSWTHHNPYLDAYSSPALWIDDPQGTPTPFVVYSHNDTYGIRCNNGATGAVAWSFDTTPADVEVSSPAVYGNAVYFTSRQGRLYCFRNTARPGRPSAELPGAAPRDPRLFVSANPSRAQAVFRASPSSPLQGDLRILDISGRLVSVLPPTDAARWLWDGRGRGGKSSPPGVYFAVPIQGPASRFVWLGP